eukprot:gene21081-7911_t
MSIFDVRRWKLIGRGSTLLINFQHLTSKMDIYSTQSEPEKSAPRHMGTPGISAFSSALRSLSLKAECLDTSEEELMFSTPKPLALNAEYLDAGEEELMLLDTENGHKNVTPYERQRENPIARFL